MKSTTSRFAIAITAIIIGVTACSGGDGTTSTEPADTSAPTTSVALAPVDFAVAPARTRSPSPAPSPERNW